MGQLKEQNYPLLIQILAPTLGYLQMFEHSDVTLSFTHTLITTFRLRSQFSGNMAVMDLYDGLTTKLIIVKVTFI